MKESIRLHNVRVNNLKNISIDIPRDKFVVVAAPKGTVKTMRATQPDSLNAVIGSFVKSSDATVQGANGATAADYDVWVWQPDVLPAGTRVGIQFLNK